jgi:hypothetical protein
MSGSDLAIFCIISGVFIVLGIIGIIWGKKEEGSWYTSVSQRIDVREYIDRAPGRPEPGSLKIGGRICLAVGVIILLVGVGFYLWG